MARLKLPSRMSEKELRSFLASHIGDLLAIPLDGDLGFGRVIRNGYLACYDFKIDRLVSIDEIAAAPVLFVVPVFFDVYATGKWSIIGNRPLEPELDRPVTFFREDAISGEIDVYRDGEFYPLVDEDPTKLERLTVWSADSIEWRLRSHFAGACDLQTEKLKYKPRNAMPSPKPTPDH